MPSMPSESGIEVALTRKRRSKSRDGPSSGDDSTSGQLSHQQPNQARPSSERSAKVGKSVAIPVHFLDNSATTIRVQTKSLGRQIFDQVCQMLNIIEIDYFGLEYFDENDTRYWLDLEKPIARQLSFNFSNPRIYFAVKFYTPDPSKLEDELTRYLYCLQIKKDLSEGLLQCNENTAALMASYIIQAEIGDFNATEYQDQNYVARFKLIPDQEASFEWKVMENHKKHIGQSPTEADMNLLETARRCELYGVKMTPVTDHEGVPLNLAVTHAGVLLFQNATKINTFSWTKIRKLSFKRKRFLLKLHKEDCFGDIIEFLFESRNQCKNFWKKCIEQHTFFRCSVAKKCRRNKGKLFSRGSSFRYSGRTQQQVVEYLQQTSVRKNQFQRSSSLRTFGKRGTDAHDMSAPLQPLLPISSPNLDQVSPITVGFDPQRSQSAMEYRTEAQEQYLSSPGSTYHLKESECGSSNASILAPKSAHSYTNQETEKSCTLCGQQNDVDNSCDSLLSNTNLPDDSILSETKICAAKLEEPQVEHVVMPKVEKVVKVEKVKKVEKVEKAVTKTAEVKAKVIEEVKENVPCKPHRKEKQRSRPPKASRSRESEKRRRAFSAPRNRTDFSYYESKANPKVSPTLFARADRRTSVPSKKPKSSPIHYVMLNSLPSLDSFSSQDDTLCDPIDDLIDNKIQSLLKKSSNSHCSSMQNSLENELNALNAVCSLSSSSLPKGKVCLYSRSSEEQSDNPESDYGSIEFLLDSELKERKFMKQSIIDYYLAQHYPDDLDKDLSEAVITERDPVPLSMYNSLSDFITKSNLNSITYH